ncbi:hypothetical protein D623_10025827 [Myotis brandtii]|uniref:Uncharacterized protein n=1 Tax=Myotis brandtii TaxID=109478 RepID=S7PS38_MYOBR|nr:hypothetical protein D623_10025827 [Myotis brandtii]
MRFTPNLDELEDKKELSAESEDEELQLEEFPTLKTLDPTPDSTKTTRQHLDLAMAICKLTASQDGGRQPGSLKRT